MKKWMNFGFCLSLSLLFLLICTKSSPLYQMNDWVDAQAFFTVGKGMVRGVVPYLDLFEQKGPLLYLIYGIGSIFSYKSLIGVFFIEVLFFAVFLFYCFKILELYIKPKIIYMILPFLCFLILPLRCFTHGGSVEEFAFPFFIISLYHLIKYFKNDTISRKEIFINGIIAGAILWMKYTLLGFWFAWMMVVFFEKIIKKQYKEAFIDCFIYLGGMILISIPWLIYFFVNHGLKAMIDVYFTFNINSYSSHIPISTKIIRTFDLIIQKFKFYKIFTLFIFIPTIISIFTKTLFKEKRKGFWLFLCGLFLSLGIYIGGTNYRYYPLLIAPLMIIGLIYVGIILEKGIKEQYIQKSWHIVTVLIIGYCFYSTYQVSPNTKMIGLDKSDYAQFVFAEIINKKENSTILNYGFLDGGFYTTTGVIPNIYYFTKNNISHKIYPNLMNSQRDYIKEGKIDFVIARNPNIENQQLIKTYYHEVARKNQIFEGKFVEYVLYEKNEI